ncbi:unnamed protein product [Vicia faba]|uniref:Uncharacterized protein n=1 Tax=Vicia faba TaxID=3906 RepID=A0AAV0ZA45_VICFA|nr:unnamed protein product [Vicia faba]
MPHAFNAGNQGRTVVMPASEVPVKSAKMVKTGISIGKYGRQRMHHINPSMKIHDDFKVPTASNFIVDMGKRKFLELQATIRRQKVPPLDVPELLAYFVKQPGPFLDQLGVSRDTCDKIVESLYRKRKYQLLPHSVSEEDSFVLWNGNEPF